MQLIHISIALFFFATTAGAEVIPVRSAIMPTSHAVEYEQVLRNYLGNCILVLRINYTEVEKEIAAHKQVHIWDDATKKSYPFQVFYQTILDEDTCKRK